MSALLGMLCGIVSAFTPCTVTTAPWMRDVRAVTDGDTTIVAAVLAPIYYRSEKEELLSQYASDLAETRGESVILTHDLSCYIALLRMERRGYNEEAMRVFLQRIASIKAECNICDKY